MKYKNRFIGCALIVLLSLILIGCAADDGQRFYNKKQGYSIVFPEDWRLKENYSVWSIMAVSPFESASDKFKESVSVYVEKLNSPVSSEEYYQSIAKQYPQILTGYKLLNEGKTIINGKKAKWIYYSYAPDGTTLNVFDYLISGKKRAYVITCSAEPDKVTKYQALFNQIVKSFKIK